MSISSKSAHLATMAAMLAMSAATFAADAPAGSTGESLLAAGDTVHCYGINSCKGTADCKTTEHACKGMNSCKGQGFKAEKAGTCLTKKGTIGDIGAK